MDEFYALPGYPGYSINPLGRIRSERTGLMLTHDMQGRVRLRKGTERRAFFVGELLALAGLAGKSAGGGTPPVEPPPKMKTGAVKTAARADAAREKALADAAKKAAAKEKTLADAAKAEKAKAKELAASLDKARRLNAHYQALVDTLRGEVAALQKAAKSGGRGKRSGGLPVDMNDMDELDIFQ